jgi:hypothetical protein
MGVSDDELRNPKNRFVAVAADATVGQAIAAWQDLQGESWWHLIVRMDDGSFRAATFSDLYSALQGSPDAAETQVRVLADLTPVPAAERDAIDTSGAKALARKTPIHVLVVTCGDSPVGIVVEGLRRGAGLMSAAADLGELGGKYVKLKDYGSILLAPLKKPSPTPR